MGGQTGLDPKVPGVGMKPDWKILLHSPRLFIKKPIVCFSLIILWFSKAKFLEAANTGEKDTGGSQFFINTVHNDFLDWWPEPFL